MAKVITFVNIINRNVSGVSSLLDEIIKIDLDDYTATATCYLEVSAQNANASSQTIDLDQDDNPEHTSSSNVLSLSITGSTSTYTRFLSGSFSLSSTDIYYRIQPNSTDLTIQSARIVIKQDTSTNELAQTVSQFEIGNFETLNNETLTPLTYPKYWKYESAKFDPTPIFNVHVSANAEDDMYHHDLYLQEDDGAFGNWSSVLTIASTFTSEDTTLIESSPFTPKDGRHYRLADQAEDSKGDIYISNAKIVATVNGISDRNETGISLTNATMYSSSIEGVSQSIIGNGNYLQKAYFDLEKAGSPTGNVYARLYASTGTHGSNAEPTGSYLSQSDAVDVSTLPTSHTWVEFTFSSMYQLNSGTTYCIVFVCQVGDSSNYVRAYRYGSGDHDGNYAYSYDALSSWTTLSSSCLNFRIVTVNESPPKIYNIQSELLLINTNETATGLSEHKGYHDPNDIDGYNLVAFNEHIGSEDGIDYVTQTESNAGTSIYGGDGIGSLEALGQSFEVDIKGVLMSIELPMLKTGSPTDNTYIEIASSIGGSTLATSSNIDNSTLDTISYQWFEFTFSSPPILDAETTYYFRVLRSGARDTSDYPMVRRSTSNPYSDGVLYDKDTGSWGENSGDDLAFKMDFSSSETKIQEDTDDTASDLDNSTAKGGATGGELHRSQIEESYETGTSTASILGGTGTDEEQGQSFELSAAETIYAIEVYADKIGSPTDNILCRLTSSIGGTVLGTSEALDMSDLSSSDHWLRFHFLDGVSLSASTTYYLEIYRSGSRDASNYLNIYYNASGVYADGQRYEKNSGSWAAQTGEDIQFKIKSAMDLPTSADEIDAYVVTA
jgi:hypothetical protein